MASFSQFGNDLHTGKRSFNIVGKRKVWYLVAAVMILIAIVGPLLRGGFVFGIEFTGGSTFVVSDVAAQGQTPASDAVANVVPDAVARVTTVGTNSIQVQTDQLTSNDSRDVSTALAKAYDVPETQVTSSFIGPSWGADITGQALRGLLIFLALAAVVMALYFRTWKMSLAAMIALLHDLIITAGFYGLTGFEITPAAVIGFLTILGYSLYDTVVVFDKVRENTAEESNRTFAGSVNLAVNQTLVRSINTSVVAVLPVASILVIGAFILGAGTLRDISLALLIGMIVGTYSTIFIAAPLYANLREGEPAIRKADKKALALQAKASQDAKAEVSA
ncbi:protein translocase subunit SecF [Glaciibacter psychrotolerans]|uniref:Protein-export membrane protein SecF n=1 Tax=Glaciibacter psychrotolerans TaxID=670054 RepID=A0A7Z0ECF4_9MICO|nr:protein translocase subunit SecF [Leifsonia psychrotolerans]NYJ19044.1 preprotein translocase subunit SecF [Leifsonia psychrotolerans]